MKTKAEETVAARGARPRRAATKRPRKERAPSRAAPAVPASGQARLTDLDARAIESLRQDLERRSSELLPRWGANPEDVQKSVAQLVLALVEFLRKLLERQAIRRMEAGTLDPDEIERIGLSLMRLEETVHEMAARFGLRPEELNLDLGPLGRLS